MKRIPKYFGQAITWNIWRFCTLEEGQKKSFVSESNRVPILAWNMEGKLIANIQYRYGIRTSVKTISKLTFQSNARHSQGEVQCEAIRTNKVFAIKIYAPCSKDYTLSLPIHFVFDSRDSLLLVCGTHAYFKCDLDVRLIIASRICQKLGLEWGTIVFAFYSVHSDSLSGQLPILLALHIFTWGPLSWIRQSY